MKKLLCLLVVIIDQIIKYFVVSNLTKLTVIPDFFTLEYVKNTGSAFSLFTGHVTLLIIISIIILCFLYKFLKKEDLIFIFLMGGILSNLIDRIFRGYVIDYLSFKIFNYNFPVFNLADICIVVSCIILIIKAIQEEV